MFRDVVQGIQNDIHKIKQKTGEPTENSKLADVNVENISDEDLSKIFKSEEVG